MTTTKKPPTASQIIERLARNPRDEEARDAAREKFGELRIWAKDGDAIDADLTLSYYEHVRDGGDPIDGALTLREVLAELAHEQRRDPISGRKLLVIRDKQGRDQHWYTTDKPRVDWLPVGEEGLLVTAYAIRRGEARGMTSEMVVYALSQDTPPPPWGRLASEWAALIASKKPADMALVADVRAMIAWEPAVIAWEPSTRPAVDDAPAFEIASMQTDRSDLRDRLARLLPAQFEDIVFRLGINPAHLTPTGPLASRAMELVRIMEQRAGGLDALRREIIAVARR